MALVSYGASDDSDLSEEEEEEVENVKASAAVSAGKTTVFQSNGHISDEEDEFLGGGKSRIKAQLYQYYLIFFLMNFRPRR